MSVRERGLRLPLAALLVLSLLSACAVHPNDDIDTQTPAFKQARSAGLVILQQRVDRVTAGRIPYAIASSDSCLPGYRDFEHGKSSYQWHCMLERSVVLGLPGNDRHAAYDAARPMLQARGCPDLGRDEPEGYPWIDQPVGQNVYGLVQPCSPPAALDLRLISIDHPEFGSLIRDAASGVDHLAIGRQAVDPLVTADRLRQNGIKYVLIVDAGPVAYYDVPW